MTLVAKSLENLIMMLRYKRPNRSKSEKKFIETYITPLGAKPDDFGNYIMKIGESPVLWSSHTDTVHKSGGIQKLVLKGTKTVGILAKDMDTNCLGADCTTGVWLMAEMIKEKVPGLYIFHRGEEIGGLGSKHIRYKTPDVLKGIKFAIALDRFGTTSVITRQIGGKCASQQFVDSISPMLPGKYKADPGGSFTDTANYTELVSECSNLSVGYKNQHSFMEEQDLEHALLLRASLIGLDQTKLIAARDPTVKEYHYPLVTNNYWEEDGGRYYEKIGFDKKPNLSDSYSMERLIKANAEAIADMLREWGYDAVSLWEELSKTNSNINN